MTAFTSDISSMSILLHLRESIQSCRVPECPVESQKHLDCPYWHCAPAKVLVDEHKSRDLLAAGFSVVRLREDNLPALDIDHPYYQEVRVHSTVARRGPVMADIHDWITDLTASLARVTGPVRKPLPPTDIRTPRAGPDESPGREVLPEHTGADPRPPPTPVIQHRHVSLQFGRRSNAKHELRSVRVCQVNGVTV
ncbi:MULTISPECIES: hypothetical protein [unclassified Rhodococcus (in: high G+C Gram-positive bacteria)]|uniref:hypothetical protein n=1 Tax=unclassified Rhodococcus (in: high G+C Gram-positive bacteria) TaxID=192944 RepID=UPI0002FDF5F5|nr:hypothetical protein [Rhodococcus sp. DK17]